MADTNEDTGYSVAEAARLLGVTQDALRKRLAAGTLRPAPSDQQGVRFDRDAVDAERASLLEKLDALDARSASDASATLRKENEKLRASIAALMVAQQAVLDSLREWVAPHTPDD